MMPRKPERPEVHKRCNRCGEHGPHGTTVRNGKTRTQSECRECSHLRAVWRQMVKRCSDPLHDRYERYGGRGIEVCRAWEDFDFFVTDMGPRPGPGYSLGRIDNDGNYEPGNCRWETREQQMNNMSTNRMVTIDGKTQSIARWAREIGIERKRVMKRIELGWDPAVALTEPVKPKPRATEAEIVNVIELHKKGVEPHEIARRSGKSLTSVKRWIEKRG